MLLSFRICFEISGSKHLPRLRASATLGGRVLQFGVAESRVPGLRFRFRVE